MKLRSSLALITTAAAVLVLGAFASSSRAETIAYWRFEDQVNGGQLIGSFGGDPHTVTADYSPGGSNALRTFNGPTDPNTSATFNSYTPAGIVPQTGAANRMFATFAGGQDLYTDVGNNVNAFTFNNFTLEATILSSATGFHTFLGKDGNQGQNELGRVYFQQRGDNGDLGVSVRDKLGNFIILDSGFNIANTNTVYNVAAVSNGTTLSIYLQNPANAGAYTLLNSTFTDGGLINEAATWTVGRGWFGGPADQWVGGLDEIRISDVALTPSQFLGAVPEPNTALATLCGLAVAGVVLRRQRAARG